MTVCIAAVCDALNEHGPFIITAADRMITIGEIEYEPAQTKTVILANQTIALLAGDMTFHAAVIPVVEERIKKQLADEPSNINVSQIAEIYAEEFSYRRRALAEREILFPRGLNFDRFALRQSQLAHYQVDRIDSELLAYRIDATALIAGIDPLGGHIFRIDNPGMPIRLVPAQSCAT